MSHILSSGSASDILRQSSILVTKIGGENATLLRANYEQIAARARQGIKQIIVVSALRSADKDDDIFAHSRVMDTSADGRTKHGFNTTSHLIAIGEHMQASRGEQLDEVVKLCENIGNFTRASLYRELRNTPDSVAIEELEHVIWRLMDGNDSPDSVSTIVQRNRYQKFQRVGEDWLIEQSVGKMERQSITGRGEDLAGALYLKYLRHKKMAVGAIDLSTDNMKNIANGSSYHVYTLLQQELRRQMIGLFEENDVIIAGGYLPHLGSQRGYSDKTGAFLAQIAQKTYKDPVAYLVEKSSPIMSADPRCLKNARLVPKMTYFLAKELFGNTHGANGAAIHPEALDMLAADSIPTLVSNPHQPDAASNTTLIAAYDPPPNGMEIVAARKVPTTLEIRSADMISQVGFLKEICDFFAIRKEMSIDQIATSEGSISLTFTVPIPIEWIDELKDDLRGRGVYQKAEDSISIEVLRDKSMIFCLGNNMTKPGVASRATLALELVEADIHLITQGLNERVMAFLIDDDKVDDALSLLHDFCILLPEDAAADLMREMRVKIFAAVKLLKESS